MMDNKNVLNTLRTIICLTDVHFSSILISVKNKASENKVGQANCLLKRKICYLLDRQKYRIKMSWSCQLHKCTIIHLLSLSSVLYASSFKHALASHLKGHRTRTKPAQVDP